MSANKVVNFGISYGTSRGRDTYGYNIISLQVLGGRRYRAMGGGYDMFGTVLGRMIEDEFQDELKAAWGGTYQDKYYGEQKFSELYGLSEREGTICCTGGCGYNYMEKILKAMGYTVTYTWKYNRQGHPDYRIGGIVENWWDS